MLPTLWLNKWKDTTNLSSERMLHKDMTPTVKQQQDTIADFILPTDDASCRVSRPKDPCTGCFIPVFARKLSPPSKRLRWYEMKNLCLSVSNSVQPVASHLTYDLKRVRSVFEAYLQHSINIIVLRHSFTCYWNYFKHVICFRTIQ
jgi:hypothetical protein